MPTETQLKTGLHNTSEIGGLKKVMLHRPGRELENLMPEYLERLLFDDIPYLKVAQAEHDAFAQCLRENGAEVVYLTDLVEETIAEADVRKELTAFWIEFREDVTDAGIARFMDAHAADGTGFTAHGMFCTRYDKEKSEDIVQTIQYTAPDILDAAMDLADWRIDDATGIPGHGGMNRTDWDRDRDAARIVTGNMDPGTADALYRAVWKDRLKQEIAAWIRNAGTSLTPEQLDYAAQRWVYDGKYDCGLSHWENIAEIVKLAQEFA